MRNAVFGLTLCALTGIQALAAPNPTQQFRVSVDISSQSWRGTQFDRAGFEKQCTVAGVTLVDIKDSTVDAAATIDYRELQGSGFSPYGIGTPTEYGTWIRFNLALRDPKTGKAIARIEASASSTGGIRSGLHNQALESFRLTPQSRFACATIAAQLGSVEQAAALLPWAVLSENTRGFLSDIKFKPRTPVESAYLAVARRDMVTTKSLGQASVEPLLLLFRNSAKSRDYLGTFNAWSPSRHAELMIQATAILASFPDPNVLSTLTDFLADYAGHYAKSQRNLAAVVSHVLTILGPIGDASTLPAVEKWLDDGLVGPDAKKAAEMIRKRIAK